MLRNLPPDRTATPEGVAATFIYGPDGFVERALADARGTGLIAPDAIRLTELGVAAVERVQTVSTAIVMEMWPDVRASDIESIAALTTKALNAAAANSGEAFRVMWPLYSPEGTPTAARLAESLTALRFHRFDAHVAAWRAAGLTAAEIQVLEPGDTRDAIEADTNERAAVPYTALNGEERQTLIDGLAGLPAPT